MHAKREFSKDLQEPVPFKSFFQKMAKEKHKPSNEIDQNPMYF